MDMTPDKRSLDYRRGFRRLFALGWIAYAIMVLVAPFYLVGIARQEAMQRYADSYVQCIHRNDALQRTEWQAQSSALWSQCERERDQIIARERLNHRPTAYYRALGWHAVWVLPLVLFVPPLIVYGLCVGIARVLLWVRNGFYPTHEAV
jgi:hypothetical protein